MGKRSCQLASAGQSANHGQIGRHCLAGNSYFPCGKISISSFSEPLGINIEGLNSLLHWNQLFIQIQFDELWYISKGLVFVVSLSIFLNKSCSSLLTCISKFLFPSFDRQNKLLFHVPFSSDSCMNDANIVWLKVKYLTLPVWSHQEQP